MLSEMIPCPAGCDNGIETCTHIKVNGMTGWTARQPCPTCEGKGYIVEQVRQPPGAGFFAPDNEAG